MVRINTLRRDEEGTILILTALILPLVMTIVAGGIVAFGMLNGQRELQAAADHAALAAAAALPPVDPNVALDSVGFPMQICVPGTPTCTPTSAIYTIMNSEAGNLLQTGQLIPDPRAVACAYAQSDLSSGSAPMVGAFANPNLTATPAGDRPTVCTQFDKINGRQIINDGHTVPDTRIYPSLQPGTVLTCIDAVTAGITSALTGQLGAVLNATQLASIINAVVDPLNQIAPALLSPRVKVDVSQGYNPPLLSLITGRQGTDLLATATARRRLKNAIVIKLQPGMRVGLQITGGVNMTASLEVPQTSLLSDLTAANTALVNLENSLANLNLNLPGLNCTNPLGDLILDLKDIYNPTTGASSAEDLVSQAVNAVASASVRTGIPASSIEPSGFLAIGVGNASNSTTSLGASIQAALSGLGLGALNAVVNVALGPLASIQMPILDAALVTFSDAGNGKFAANCIPSPSYPNCPVLVDAANAWGAFRATLVQ